MSLVLCKRWPTYGMNTEELVKNHVAIRAIMEGQIAALKKRPSTNTMRSGAKMCTSRSESWLLTHGSNMGRGPSRSPLDLGFLQQHMHPRWWLCFRCASCFSCAHKTRLLELTPMSVPRGAGSAIAEKAQPLVETPLSLKIPLIWSCDKVPRASGFGEIPDLGCTPAATDEKRTLETFTPEPTRATFWTERNLSIHTCWHHDVECSSDLQLSYRETASRIGALLHTCCAQLTFVGDEKDVVTAVRGRAGRRNRGGRDGCATR